MARPDLYLERIETANEKESKALSANFRSRSDVINYANMIFEQIMTEESSMIDYSKGHSLESRGSFGDYALQGAQIQHFYLQTDATHKIRKQAQAKFVIGKVQELLNGGEVYDSSFGGMRPVRYGDIAILKRKIKGDAEIYVEQFRKAGIPVTVSGSVEIKDTDEFRDITALLTILDNNTDQIALATVLRSPFYSFADSELAELAFDGPLKFSSLERYSGDYQGLKDKIEAFLSDYNSLREHAYKISLPELVWKIVNLNQYISFATMMQGGKFRRANLLAIHNLAERYSRFKSQMGSVSLQSFLNYLEGLSDKESGDLVAEQVDAVSIQSFHKSKGLEYPIVILPDLETNFRGLSIDDVVCDEKLGLALRTSINEGAENTAQFDKIRQEQLSQQIDEERRLLYVAVTRAKEKLILVAAGADPDKTGDGKSYWDWIRPCVSIEVVSPDDLQDLGKTESSISSGSKDSMLKLLCDNSQLARLVVNPKLQPVKMSASSINHDENAFPLRAFANDAKIKTMVDPRVRGTAVHLIFENTIKLRRRIAPKDVIDIISKLQTEALLTEDIANTIDVDSIVSFFETEIGQDSLKEKSYSEWPFTAYIDRSEFEDLKSGKVIVQGVVGLLIDYGDYVRIVDFKTDNITHQTMQPRVDIYAGQLKAYSIAAERVLGKPVRSSMLYFVTIKELIAL